MDIVAPVTSPEPAPADPLPALPPAGARGRLASVAAGRARSSLESVAGTAGLRLVGFDPLTEVMGCVVSHLGWFGCQCGYGAMNSPTVYTSRTLVSGVHKRGFAPYGKAVQSAWNTALSRLLDEAAAVGADGVVGIRPTRRRLPGLAANDEFILLGTAVRARGDVRPHRPFATDLGGDRFAALVRGGWIPAGYTVTVAVGVRHDDWRSQQSTHVWSGNQEVLSFTELVHDTRRAARDQFARALTRDGAETAILTDMRLRTWEIRVGGDHTDHLCEVTLEGTGAVAYQRRAPTGPAAGRPLTVLPLTDPRTRGNGPAGRRG